MRKIWVFDYLYMHKISIRRKICMDRNDVIGAGQIAGGSYLGYQGVKRGLPRALGIRIEYHTTSKDNAKLIKKAGNVLDPAFGGRNGWSEKIKSNNYVKNSEKFVHITGINKNTDMGDMPKLLSRAAGCVRPVMRKIQTFMYRAVGNSSDEGLNKFKNGSKKDALKWFGGRLLSSTVKSKTKTFCIPGIDSYFDKNFINDADDPCALKSVKKLKVYNNRFSAMIGGLKKFGLKGIKENKSRVAVGLGAVAMGLYGGYKLITAGLNKIAKG